MMKKIYFDEQGFVGTMQGDNLFPIKENEKMVCTEAEAATMGLDVNEWITLEALRDLPNAHAEVAYKIFTGTLNS